MKIVYIAHCISGDIETNLADLRRIIRKINLNGDKNICPIAPYYVDVVSMDDSIPEQRKRGIRNDTAVIKSGLIDEVWLTGPTLSKGMTAERDLARNLNIPVINMIGLL